jgi:D-alanyl-D-alanine carboxypeptidase
MKKFLALLSALIFIAGCLPIEPILEADSPQLLMNGYVESDDPVRPSESDETNGQTESSAPTPVLIPSPENAVPPSQNHIINSGGVYMYNFETGEAVYARNEHMLFPPASIAKIMTLLVVLENVSDLNAFVVVTDEAFWDFESGDPNFEDAATARTEIGQANLTYLDCLYALMLASGADVSNILAYNVGNGSLAAFADMMNAKAREIGALNSNFTNASGLYEYDFYSTAYDMFLITMYAMENYPMFLEIALTPSYEMPPNSERPEGYTINNTSARLRTHHDLDFADGIKTGSIFEVFRGGVRFDGFTTFVSMAQKDGMSFLLVTMDADYYIYDEDGNRSRSGFLFTDHVEMYEWAYGTFTITYE